jgi:hypothetical protein
VIEFPRVKIPTFAAIVVVLGGIATIMKFFEQIRSWFVGGWNWAKRPIRHTSPYRVELKITPSQPLCTWQEGGHDGHDEMLVNCRLFLTNVGPAASFQVLDVMIKEPRVRGEIRVPPNPPEVVEHMGARLAVNFDCRFTIRPPVVKSGRAFICDILIKDQFGEEHRARKVEFAPVGMKVWTKRG